MSPARRAWLRAGALCALVLALDQGAKAAVESSLVGGQHVGLAGPLGLTLSHNPGVAFGLASGSGDAALTAVTLVVLAFLLFLFARNPLRPGMWVAVGLLAGGALGNLADRLRAGAVTDYIDVNLFSWPPFNLADVSVTVGVLLLALSYMREPGGEGER